MRRAVCRLSVLGIAASGCLLMAGMINPGFESESLPPWSSGGDVQVVSSFTSGETAIAPHDGRFFAFLRTGALDAGAVETALGLAPETLSGLVPDPTTGAYVAQHVAMAGGESITEWAFFLAGDVPPYNDFAFWSFAGPGGNAADLIGSVMDDGFGANTGWVSFRFTAPQTGLYTIGFGVFNQTDPFSQSFLFVDGVQAAIPEPATPAFLGVGLAVFAGLRRRCGSTAARCQAKRSAR